MESSKLFFQRFLNLQVGCVSPPFFDNAPVYFWGSSCVNEDNYAIEVFEVSQSGSTTPLPGSYTEELFSGKVPNTDLGNLMNYNFSSGKIYCVKLTTFNDCQDIDEITRYFSIPYCSGYPEDDDPDEIIKIKFISPNPVNNSATLDYELTDDRTVSISIHDQYTGTIQETLQNDQVMIIGSYSLQFDVSTLPVGSYYIKMMTQEEIKIELFNIIR